MGVQGGPGCSRRSKGGVQGGCRGSRSFATKHEKLDKRSGAICQAYYAAASRIVCRRFQ